MLHAVGRVSIMSVDVENILVLYVYMYLCKKNLGSKRGGRIFGIVRYSTLSDLHIISMIVIDSNSTAAV